jgi:transcriptional regulator with XRE-family HTH domain
MSQIDRIRAALKRIVEERGLAETGVSKRAGLAHTTLGDFLSGKTNNPKIKTLEQLALAMGLTAAEMSEIGLDTGQGAAPQPTGFAESEAVPYHAAPEAWPVHTASDDADAALARVLAPSARNATLYRISRDMPCAGLWSGDVLVIDLAARPLNGQLVVANVADPTTAEAHTIVRLLYMPHLIDDPMHGAESVLVDNVRTTILAPVVASFRPEQTARRI